MHRCFFLIRFKWDFQQWRILMWSFLFFLHIYSCVFQEVVFLYKYGNQKVKICVTTLLQWCDSILKPYQLLEEITILSKAAKNIIWRIAFTGYHNMILNSHMRKIISFMNYCGFCCFSFPFILLIKNIFCFKNIKVNYNYVVGFETHCLIIIKFIYIKFSI